MKKHLLTRFLSRFTYLLVLGLTMLTISSYAQVAPYTFAPSSGTYTPITGGSVIVTATVPLPTGNDSAAIEDYLYEELPLPFSFYMGGNTFNSFRAHSNGYIGLGSGTIGTTTTTPISTSGFSGVISAMGTNLAGIPTTAGTVTTGSDVITAVTNTTNCVVGAPIQGTGIPANSTITAFTANTITISALATSTAAATFISWATGEIRTEVLGTAPNRTFVIQYSGMARYNTTATGAGAASRVNFQIRLNEANGVPANQTVTIVYGSCANPGTSTTTQVGIRGSATTDYNNRLTTTNWATTTAGTAATSTCTFSPTVAPASGQTFTWTPPAACAAPTAQATGLSLLAGSTVVSGTYTAASPVVTGYVVLRTPGVATPSITPADYNSYPAGATLGNATVVANVTGTTFTDNTADATTNYTYTIYAYNSGTCAGPIYNTIAPPSGNISTTPPAAYVWNATMGTADAALPGSWSPPRNFADPTDTLYFTNPGSSTATNLSTALFSVAKIGVQNNTTIILNSATTATNFAINKELIVDAGSTLELSGANSITLSFASGNLPTATINGNLNMSGTGTCAYNATNAVTTVSGSVTTTNTGSIAGTSLANMIYTAGANYNIARNGGSLPLATYAPTSNVNVTGVTSTTLTPGAVDLGNFTWNCPAQTVAASLGSTVDSIYGNCTFVSTGTTGSVAFGNNPNVQIMGDFIQTGGTYIVGNFTSGVCLIDVYGDVNLTGGTFNVNSGASGTAAYVFRANAGFTQGVGNTITRTANIAGASGTIIFGGTTSLPVTMNGTVTNHSISFTLDNPAGRVLNSVIPINQSGVNTITSGTWSGTGSFTYSGTPTLAYNGADDQTATTFEYLATGGPTSLTVAKTNNSKLTLPFSRTVTGTLTLTSGEISLGSNELTLGVSATAPGTSSGTGAFISSGTYTRWFGVTGLPIVAGTTVGFFPMGVAGSNRNVSVYFNVATALSTGGTISVTHNPAPGLAAVSVLDVATSYTIEKRTNGSWTFVTGNGLALSGANTIGVRATGANLISPITVANIRLMQTNAVVGTHVAGTGTIAVPQAARTGLTVADLNASPYHMGAADADVNTIFTAINNGDWGTAATWDGGIVPTITDRVVINTGVTVNIGTGTNAAKFLTNNGTLTVNANTLTIDTSFVNNGTLTIAGGTLRLGPVNGGNRLMTNSGTTTVSSGILEVNGGISSPAGSTFNQSGGLIAIDPNDGTLAGSLIAASAFGTVTNNLDLSAGTLRIVDPLYITNTANYAVSSNVNPTATTYYSGTHTIELGNGTSTTPGGANGFRMYSFAGTGYAVYRNITVNGGAGAGRWGNFGSLSAFSGTLTVNNGSEMRHSTTLYAGGNIVNNGRILTTSILNFGASTAGTYTLPAAPVLSGTGEWRNKIPTVATYTANGTGYTVGDVVTLTGGTFTTPATFVVTTVNGTGGITAATVVEPGSYTAVPTGANGVTGGTGADATFTMQAATDNIGYLIPTANVVSLTSNNTNGVVLPNMLSYSGSLAFTLGKMVMGTGTGTMIQIAGASTTGQGANTGWVVGAFQKAVAVGGLGHFFPMGDATNYTPVNIAGTAATPGDIVVSTTAGDHPNMGSGASGIAADKSVNRFYTITSLNGVTYDPNSLTITFNWTAGDVDPTADPANFIAAKYDGTTWTTPLAVANPNPTSIMVTGISSFSAFQIGEPYNPLAIKLVRISAANVGVRNRVDWTSATETAGDYYELERSTDGKNFARIATIEGTGKGADYTYYDELPVNGLNYYRLKLVNIDAQSAYSRTVTATVKAATTFVVEAYPNPVTDKLTVNVTTTPDGAASISLIDLTGKVVRTAAVDGNRAAIDMNGMPAGIYMLRYQDASHDVTIKVTKQ